MTDKSQTAFADKELDQVLGSAFPTSRALSSQFEDQVMLKVDAIDMARSRHRKVAHTMAVYWGIATAIMSGLLAGSPFFTQAASVAVVAVTLATLVSGSGLAWFIARQSGIRLQSLFARTLL